MGFIIHFYIIFGTNLLTGGPTQIAVFLPISVFRRKRISNGVQKERNLRQRDFRNKRDPEDLDPTSRKQPGRHEVGGAPPPSWAARDSPGPSPILRGLLLVQKISSVKFQVNWTPFDFPLLRYSKTRKKQKLALGSKLIG